MKPTSASPEALAREELAIRFVNTVAWRLREPAEDRIAAPAAMLTWMLEAGLLDRTAFTLISARWKISPQDAQRFGRAACQLREAIYRLLVAQIDGKAADESQIAILNRHLGAPMQGIALAPVHGALAWRGGIEAVDRRSLLKPIAWSAANLLTGPRVSRLKQCQDERGCGWLFMDESRAQNRRWCSMGDCGNLAKSRRHFHRMSAKAVSAPATPD